MVTKIKVTVTYDNESEETLKINSDGSLVDNVSELKSYIDGSAKFSTFLNVCKTVATFLWSNDIKKLEFEEKEEE